uniref:Uncharacterized protein n=1 Tax=Chlamydomonas leiostraca TaxID=1034604 RepID=A0A7S0RNA3_9CHLO|mmetsp:Transcript_27418/g.69719  ORF Transcript_27418/g.69719 Transcript_27418/m.69719 type:complete len:352 (+) Transcript_27418:158-1213(+)
MAHTGMRCHASQLAQAASCTAFQRPASTRRQMVHPSPAMPRSHQAPAMHATPLHASPALQRCAMRQRLAPAHAAPHGRAAGSTEHAWPLPPRPYSRQQTSITVSQAQQRAQPASQPASQPGAGGRTVHKVLHVVRHGPSEMSAYMSLHRYGSPHQEPLRDPMLFDARLSAEGARVARALRGAVAALHPPPEAVLVSPLTRCLQTAQCAGVGGEGWDVPVQVEPLLRERVTLSSEVGRHPGDLAAEFPQFSFPPDMPAVWWWAGEGGANTPAQASGAAGGWGAPASLRPGASIEKEPEAEYTARLAALRAVLAARPERVLLLVSHWGVIRALTGRELSAGQMAAGVEVELPL